MLTHKITGVVLAINLPQSAFEGYYADPGARPYQLMHIIDRRGEVIIIPGKTAYTIVDLLRTRDPAYYSRSIIDGEKGYHHRPRINIYVRYLIPSYASFIHYQRGKRPDIRGIFYIATAILVHANILHVLITVSKHIELNQTTQFQTNH